MICKNDFESLVEFAGNTVCEDCYERPSMIVVKLLHSYFVAYESSEKAIIYNKINEYSSELLFNANCICHDIDFYVCDIIGRILSKRGDSAYNVFLNIIDTDFFNKYGYWICFSNMSDGLKYKLGLLYNNALRAKAMKDDCVIEFLFGEARW